MYTVQLHWDSSGHVLHHNDRDVTPCHDHSLPFRCTRATRLFVLSSVRTILSNNDCMLVWGAVGRVFSAGRHLYLSCLVCLSWDQHATCQVSSYMMTYRTSHTYFRTTDEGSRPRRMAFLCHALWQSTRVLGMLSTHIPVASHPMYNRPQTNTSLCSHPLPCSLLHFATTQQPWTHKYKHYHQLLRSNVTAGCAGQGGTLSMCRYWGKDECIVNVNIKWWSPLPFSPPFVPPPPPRATPNLLFPRSPPHRHSATLRSPRMSSSSPLP